MNEYRPTVSNQNDSLLEAPDSVTVDHHGDLLVVDRHHKLFRWRPGAEKLETIAGSGTGGFGGDGGLTVNAMLSFPSGVAVSSRDDIFIADYQNCRIRKVDGRTQIITTVAGAGECASGGDGGQGTNAAVDYPSTMVLDGKGNLFFVESGIGRVRCIDPHGVIRAYAGTGEKGFSGDGGLSDKARLNNPSGLALDADGNLYISDFVKNRVRSVDALITTVAGNGRPARVDAIM
jgi:sugar lactone lactonase YvrE